MIKTLKNVLILQIFLLFVTAPNIFAQCNGCFELCHKKYNEVSYLTTHNAFNSAEDDFTFPNQTYGITQQLEDGVRALMIDVYDVNGTPTVYHGYASLGNVPLVSNLNEIKNFLDNNPNQIVTIIFECYTNANSIEQAFTDSGLMHYLYEKLPGNDWSTLQQMIDTNKRLMVFSDKNDASVNQKWYHYVWHHAVETHFSVSNINNFNCDFNRGNANNDLFILNHFITSTFGIPQISTAETANSNPFFINRAIECWDEHDKFPNFITVDFYHKGDCMEVVNGLNTMNTILQHLEIDSELNSIHIYPNPATDVLFITGKNMQNIILFNSKGQQIFNFKLNGNYFTLNIRDIPRGLYFIKVFYKGGVFTDKIIITRT